MSQNTCIISLKEKVFLCLFAALLLIPAVKGGYEDERFRKRMERRNLAQAPELTLVIYQPKFFFNKLGTFLNDHIGFAVFLNRIYREMLFFVFKTSPNDMISLGRDGFIMINDHLIRGVCLDSEYPDVKNLKHIADYYSKKGRRVIFAVVPSKEVLYPENINDDFPRNVREGCLSFKNRSNRFFLLREQAKKEGFVFFYPFKRFYSERQTSYFYPKENLHWKSSSVRIFCEQLFKEIGLHPGPGFSKIDKVIETRADLGSLFGFPRKTKINVYDNTQYDVKKIRKRHRYTNMVSNYYKQCSINSLHETKNPLCQKRALFLSNSFGSNASKTLAIGYKELIHIDTNRLKEKERRAFYTELVETIDPDDIIILVNDRDAVRGRIDRIARALIFDSNP